MITHELFQDLYPAPCVHELITHIELTIALKKLRCFVVQLKVKQTLFMTRFNTSRFLVTSFPGSFPWLGGGTGKGPGNKVSLPALLVSLLCFRRVLIGSLDYRFLRLATKINALFSFNDVQFSTLSMKNK